MWGGGSRYSIKLIVYGLPRWSTFWLALRFHVIGQSVIKSERFFLNRTHHTHTLPIDLARRSALATSTCARDVERLWS